MRGEIEESLKGDSIGLRDNVGREGEEEFRTHTSGLDK